MGREALNEIDAIAVGRSDRERICKETQAKRDALQLLEARAKSVQRHGLERSLQKRIFSSSRNTPESLDVESKPDLKVEQQSKAEQMAPNNSFKLSIAKSRRKITKDGARELLEALIEAYSDVSFQRRVRKLSRDVNRDRAQFMLGLKGVAFEVQKPVLERWGFVPTLEGVKEMQAAIQDHSFGRDSDQTLKDRAETAIRILYGDMYEVIFPRSVG